MKYRRFAMTLFVVILASLALGATKRPSTAKRNPWQVLYPLAQKQAQDLNKPILACFLGSDWCPHCIHLLKETLFTGEFSRWAANNVVVLIVDFPQNKPQNPQIKLHNQALKEKFSVNGYPEVLLISSGGEVIDRFGGYNGRDKWQNRLQQAIDKVPTKPQAKGT
jgi:protein disulfide-isomerase